MAAIDVDALIQEFPLLSATPEDGRRLVYLDSANTSQKPAHVIDAMDRFLRESYGPINRSAYRLAAAATDAYEGARHRVARFINASTADEIVFTRNATDALNLFAQSWSRAHLRRGDVVVLTHMEHHANIVPWQMMHDEIGIELRWIRLTDDGQLDLANLDDLLDGASVLAFTAMSNVLGTINPVADLCARARAAGAITMVDACQSVPHGPTDVQAWGADLCAFSSHKMLGPTGLGVLWGRAEILEALPPMIGGGNMIDDVRLDGYSCAPVPTRFEAGTGQLVEAVGLNAAIEYLDTLGMDRVRDHERVLTRYAIDTLSTAFGDDITIHGPSDPELRGGVLSFAFRDLHPHDVSQILDEYRVCVRAGHHCAKPLMRVLEANATVRASLYIYNSPDDIDVLVEALSSAGDIFGF